MARPIPQPKDPVWATSRASAGVAALVILAVYVGLAAYLAREHSVWSPDCGARLVQVQSVLAHWPHWWVSYPAESLDPQRVNSPLYFFRFEYGGRTYIFYSFCFALISAVLFKAFGFFGLAMPSILGGMAIAGATYGIARQSGARFPIAPMLLVALTSHIAIYSVVFWDHSVITGIAAVALYLGLLAMLSGRTYLWFAVGLLLGLGLWIHELMVPCLPAFIVGLWWLRRRVPWLQSAALLIAGTALLVLPLAMINKSVYGTYFGPHLSNNKLTSSGSILQFLAQPDQWGPGMIYTLFGWGDQNPAWTWELRDWLHNEPVMKQEAIASLWMAVPMVAWAVLALAGLWRRLWVLSLLTFAGMLASTYWLLQHTALVHSPFLVCPLLLLALAVPVTPNENATREPGARSAADALVPRPDLLRFLIIFIVVYAVLTMLKPSLGGTEWGSRHLLVTVPAMVILAWLTVESMLPPPGAFLEVALQRAETLPLLNGFALLLLLSIGMQYHGFQTVYNMHEYNRRLTEAVADSPDQVIVITRWWAGVSAAPLYYRKWFVYADREHPAPPLFARMQQEGIKSYTLIGENPRELSDFSRPFGYVPVPGAADEVGAYRFYTNRYELVRLAPLTAQPLQAEP